MWNGVGVPTRQPFGQGMRQGMGQGMVMMPMMRPMQAWGSGQRMIPGRMQAQARPVIRYGMPAPTHMPVSRLNQRAPVPKPGSFVKRVVPKPTAQSHAAVKKPTPTPKAFPTPAGVKRKLDGPSASAPASKFVRGPSGATPLLRRPPPQNGVVKSESSNSLPKAVGVHKVNPSPKVAASFLKKSAKAFPTPSKPKANAMTSSAPSQSAPSREHKDPELIKTDVKMKKVRALTKNLLDEWCSLAEDRKEESWKELATKFRQRVPLEFLQQMLDDSLPGIEENNVVKKEIVEKDPTNFIDTMQQVLSEMIEKDFSSESDLQDLSSFWVKLKIAKDSMGAALTAFLHVVIEGGDAQNASLFLHQLLTSNFITLPSLSTALMNTAKQLEDLTQTNESAWHVHAHIIMILFPKSQQTPWGYAGKGWVHKTWWQLAHSVLSAADGFRAFDILVLVLQMMQEKTGVVIRDQLNWKDPERIKQIRETLCSWGEMDEKALLETLTAYGVEIA